MITTLTIIHCFVSALLIVIVLLQFGKGAEAGLFSEATNSSAYVQKGNILTRITAVLAILFLVLSLTLSIMRSQHASKSIFDEGTPMAAPLGQGPEAKADTKSDGTAPAAAPAAESAPQNSAASPAQQQPAEKAQY